MGLDIGELRQFRSIKQVQHKNGIYMKHVQLSLGMILNLSLLFKGIAIVLGSFILSVGINFFLVLFELLDGGIIGLGLLSLVLTGEINKIGRL